MPTILRIDVDKPFLMWGSAPQFRKPCKGLKKSFSKRTFLPSVKNLTKNIPLAFSFSTGFLFYKKKKCMIKDLNERGIKASLFFQPFTVPNRDFAQELLKEGHSAGLHAVHANDYGDFSMDLTKISRSFDGKVYGFTKHDSRKSLQIYDILKEVNNG